MLFLFLDVMSLKDMNADQPKKCGGKAFTVNVHYFKGVLKLEANRKCLGSEMFQAACTCLNVKKECYFGLQFEDDKGRVVWMKKDEKVLAQIGDSKKVLFFMIRFYPSTVEEVEEGGDLKLVFEQCKEAIMTNAIYCPPELCLLLASYCLQAEYGDSPPFDKVPINSLVPGQAREARPTLTPKAWLEAVKSWHKDHRGLDLRNAMSEYIRLVQSLSMYGVSYFPVSWMGSPVYLGVCPKGVNIYYDSNLLLPKVSLKWLSIRHFRCSCKKLSVRSVVPADSDYVFYVGKTRKLKQIYSLCIGYFRIYSGKRLIRSNSLTIKPKITMSESYHEDKETDPTSEGSFNNYETLSSDSSREQLPTVEEEEEEITYKEVLIE